jgi:hypothetical protein
MNGSNSVHPSLGRSQVSEIGRLGELDDQRPALGGALSFRLLILRSCEFT